MSHRWIPDPLLTMSQEEIWERRYAYQQPVLRWHPPVGFDDEESDEESMDKEE